MGVNNCPTLRKTFFVPLIQAQKTQTHLIITYENFLQTTLTTYTTYQDISIIHRPAPPPSQPDFIYLVSFQPETHIHLLPNTPIIKDKKVLSF